ncbi:MAG: GPR endopeptidase [Clostridia bacterium]|nr:GPR endopeptidase [Clostridia bacterium]
MNEKREFIFTDLACEAYSEHSADCSGVSSTEYELCGMVINELKITDKSAERLLGKARGTYVTIQTGKLWELGEEAREAAVKVISDTLNDLMHSVGRRIEGVLVCGLGNRMVTPDAVGPITVDAVTVTRHIREESPDLYASLSPYDVSAVTPGVVGQTGMETAELVKGAVSTVKPDIVIVIDALAARSRERLATTVQLTDTGIRPGSGIGQKRRELSRETLGVPVIAIGVPTVISGATLAYDLLLEGGAPPSGPTLRAIEDASPFFLSLNESDLVVGTLAGVVASAINRTLLG